MDEKTIIEDAADIISRLLDRPDDTEDAHAFLAKHAPRPPTAEDALQEIALIITRVDNRCMAHDGPVGDTLEEMRQDEISRIWELAKPYFGDTP